MSETGETSETDRFNIQNVKLLAIGVGIQFNSSSLTILQYKLASFSIHIISGIIFRLAFVSSATYKQNILCIVQITCIDLEYAYFFFSHNCC